MRYSPFISVHSFVKITPSDFYKEVMFAALLGIILGK